MIELVKELVGASIILLLGIICYVAVYFGIKFLRLLYKDFKRKKNL